jgi:REP element-mobilizing transposase RayT
MSRPLHIKLPGDVHHVTYRGDRREPIYRDDADRLCQLDVLAEALVRFAVDVLACCLMGNHHHLVEQMRAGQLLWLIGHQNGVCTHAFTRRHSLVGHLFQGRLKTVLVDGDSHLVALCRCAERNPVAAGPVPRRADWLCSSCHAHLGLAPVPPWLAADALHGFLLGREPISEHDQTMAARSYAALINAEEAGDADFWATLLRGQICLGDEDFAERKRARAAGAPVAQRARAARTPTARGPATWDAWLQAHECCRAQALHAAYRAGWRTMLALAAACGLSVGHVSRLVRVAGVGVGETWETWET